MKKTVSVILASFFVLMLLTAVSCDKGENTSSDLPSETSSEQSDIPSEASSEASSEVSSEASSETSSEPLSEDELRYGKCEGYDPELLSRYVEYGKKHKDLTDERVVSLVGYGFDLAWYSEIKTAPNQQTKSVLVNKFYAIGEDYIPENLVTLPKGYASLNNVQLCKEAADALMELIDAAKKDGYTVKGQSGYRSYEKQNTLYTKYLKQEKGNQAAVDTYSARPGHSEHQTGYAIDIVDGKNGMYDFGKGKSYTWVKEHSWEYGYIIHYTAANEYITGYENEEWHIRYVGLEGAKIIHETGITVDEYLASLID